MKFRHDVPEGGVIPQQWCAWGAILASDGKNIGSYFMLQLPSYKMIHDVCYDRPCWGKLTFMEILRDGHNEKYRLEYFPIYDRPT